MDNHKKKRQETEEILRRMSEEEAETMELPESLRPENIKAKILEYEQETSGQVKDQEAEDGGQTGSARQEAKTAGRPFRLYPWTKRAGIVMAAAAAVLVLAVRTGAFDLFRSEDTAGNQIAADVADGVNETASKPEGALESEAGEAESSAESADTGGTGNEPWLEEVLGASGVRHPEDYEDLFQICQSAGLFTEYRYTGEEKLESSKDVGGIVNEAGISEGMADRSDNITSSPSADREIPGELATEDDFSDTNVQVEGVDEADILKTDGKYIYHLDTNLDAGKIYIYKVDGENVSKVGEIAPKRPDDRTNRQYYDMLLLNNRLAVITGVYEDDDQIYPTDRIVPEGVAKLETDVSVDVTSDYCMPVWRGGVQSTELIVYDVSDPSAPKQIAVRKQEGGYQDVRMTDGIIYLLSYKRTNSYNICDGLEKTETAKEWAEREVPSVDGELLACNRIYVPEKPQTPDYVVITSTDIQNPEKHIDSVAVMGNGAQLYASRENLYLWQTDWGLSASDPYYRGEDGGVATTIMKYSCKDGYFAAAGTAQIPGYLNNSFSMDEYKGYLRVVTTREYYKAVQASKEIVAGADQGNVTGDAAAEPAIPLGEYVTENQLYVLSPSMQITGRIENLAEGEYVKSARFFGDTGYFVTFRQTDPLFSVDLSDPAAPKIIGQLKIPGFSEYLHPYGEGLLLGIGQEADVMSGGTEGLKLSMFDVSDPANVREAAKLVVRPDMEFSYSEVEHDHHAVLVSADRNLIGFALESGGGNGREWRADYEYCVFSYSEENGFTEEITHDFREWENMYGSRGLYIGDYLYILNSRKQIVVYELASGENKKNWSWM